MLVAIVGGAGTLWGPVIGALLLTPLSSTIQASLGNSFPGAQLIVYALVMIAVILFRPSGLVGLLAPAYRRFLSALPGAGLDRRRVQKAEEARRASPA